MRYNVVKIVEYWNIEANSEDEAIGILLAEIQTEDTEREYDEVVEIKAYEAKE